MKLVISNPSPNVTVVSFSQNNLDAGNVDNFRAAMQPVIAQSATVLLDMSELSFVDSSGLGAMLSCLRSMNSKNGQLRLFGMTKPVMALFELVRMHRIFSILDTREDALEDIAK